MDMPVTTKAVFTVPQVADYVYLTRHMRADEVDQFEALTCRKYEPEVAARVFLALIGPAYVLVDATSTPQIAGGFEETSPGTFRPWLAGTAEGWARHWFPLTKFCRHRVDELLQGPARRIEIFALANRTGAHEWYRRGLGMTYEGTHRAWFADGRDAVCYAKVRT